MAEIEINIVVRQCINRRMADIKTVRSEVSVQWSSGPAAAKSGPISTGGSPPKQPDPSSNCSIRNLEIDNYVSAV